MSLSTKKKKKKQKKKKSNRSKMIFFNIGRKWDGEMRFNPQIYDTK